MDITQKAVLLRNVKYFQQLPAEILTTIAEYCQTHSMIKNEIIFTQGSTADSLYIISSGSVLIQTNDKVIAELTQGHAFGELGLIDNQPSVADAKAISDDVLLLLNITQFNQILDDIPEVSKGITKVILNYLRQNMAISSHSV